MRPILIAVITLAAFLCAVPDAQAGPLCRLGGLALRGGKAAASAPFRLVGRARANRQEARAARGCN